MTFSPEQTLWQEVLLRLIDDALNGPSGISGADKRRHAIIEARQYLTHSSEDLILVCNGAGIDVVALIERMHVKIAEAPTPDQIVSKQKNLRAGLSKQAKKPTVGQRMPGVVPDFGASQGTGGGRSAQDTPEMSMSV